MHPFNEYVTGRTDALPPEQLDRIVESYGWFTTARRVRALISGQSDAALTLPTMFRPTIPPGTDRHMTPEGEAEPVSPLLLPADEIIARFLENGSYRIVPGEGDDIEEAVTEERFEDAEGELVTEELAAIYLSQGLTEEAEEIYRKLSLRNPEKLK